MESAGEACGCKSRSFWGVLAYQVIRSDFLGFSLALLMPLPANIYLSRLQPLDHYLAQGIDIDSGLMEVLENLLPPKKLDAVVKLLDKLLENPLGAQVLLLTMRFRLDEWLEAGQK